MAGDHGHGGHHEKFQVPDWRQYKINGIKDLEWVQQSLEKKGLRDPWLRNEVWRYSDWPGFGRSIFITISKGFKWAAAAMIVTVAVDKAFGISASKAHHGEHHDEHHEEEHSSSHH